MLEEVGGHELGVGLCLELEHDAHFVGGLVTDRGDLRQLPFFHQAKELLQQTRLVHEIGDGGEDDGLLASGQFLHFILAAVSDAAGAGFVNLKQLFFCVQDLAAGRKVRSLNELEEVLGIEVGIVDQRSQSVDHLADVVRRERAAHAHGDARGAVYEELGEPGREHQRLLERVVIVRLEADRVLVDFEQQFFGDL